MNKGFQKINNFEHVACLLFFFFVFADSERQFKENGAILIHKESKNVNKILYKIFLVRKNYF